MRIILNRLRHDVGIVDGDISVVESFQACRLEFHLVHTTDIVFDFHDITDFERRFYRKEFVLTDEKLKQNYRMNCKESDEMQKSLEVLGLFSNHSEFIKLISDQTVKEMSDKMQVVTTGEISGRNKRTFALSPGS